MRQIYTKFYVSYFAQIKITPYTYNPLYNDVSLSLSGFTSWRPRNTQRSELVQGHLTLFFLLLLSKYKFF